MQLCSVQPAVPPPELPVSVQLFSVQEIAPTPELPARAQFFSVQPEAPADVLPVIVQLLTVLELAPSPEAPPEPFVSVNPDRLAPLARDAHTFDRPPLIMVKSGPFTLRTVTGPDAATGA